MRGPDERAKLKGERRMIRTALAFLLLPMATAAVAKVDAADSNSFTVSTSVDVAAAPERVYRQLGRPALWWSPAHSWSGDARNFRMDLRAGGCFCEALPKEHGSVEHGRIIFAQPGKLLRLSAALGPLQQMPVTGVLTFTITPGPAGQGSHVTLTYAVSGAIPGGGVALAPAVDGVLVEQLARLGRSLG